MIYVENKKKSSKTLAKLYPLAEVIDVTSKGDFPFVKLSPFYPHGNIPVPFSQNHFAKSVEGIWQGLTGTHSSHRTGPGQSSRPAPPSPSTATCRYFAR